MPGPLPYDISIIKEILPHRAPFLFVDRVMELTEAKKIVAEKDLLYDELFFAGHFPGRPIMPGVLVIEALAQTSGLLIGLSSREEMQSGKREERNFFLANADIKFLTPARPKETLRLDSTLKKKFGKLFYFGTAAYVGESLIAKGTLTLAEGK